MKKKIDVFAEFEALREAAPKGSLEALRDRVREALDAAKLFGADAYPYVRYTFLNKIVVESNGKVYQVPYAEMNGSITFGLPEEVEEVFVVKESAVPETTFTIIKEAKEEDLQVSEFISLSESKFNAKTSEFENVILIEAGTNPEKRRHYPESTIKEAAPIFTGLKMYINHPTKSEEKERPERDIRDWVSTIVESKYDAGKAKAKVAIHDPWLKERLQDPVFRKNIGLSINAGGKISIGLVEGKEMQIVEKILPKRQNGSASVDWVTEAGARGRVDDVLESRTRKECDMEIKDLTIDILKKERPDLVTALHESATAEIQAEAAKTKRTLLLREQQDKVSVMLKESKLPEVAQARVLSLVKETLFETPEVLKEKVDALIEAERTYINQFSAKGKINLGGQQTQDTPIKESVQSTLEGQLGIQNKEEKKA